jgi:hypothetical protein
MLHLRSNRRRASPFRARVRAVSFAVGTRVLRQNARLWLFEVVSEITAPSGKVEVVWLSSVIKNARLPERDSAAKRSRVDGTACVPQAGRARPSRARRRHALSALTWFARTRYRPNGGREAASVGRVRTAGPTPSARSPRPSGRGGCQSLLFSRIRNRRMGRHFRGRFGVRFWASACVSPPSACFQPQKAGDLAATNPLRVGAGRNSEP